VHYHWHRGYASTGVVPLGWSRGTYVRYQDPQTGLRLVASRRLPGGPIRRYKDSLKTDLKTCGTAPRDVMHGPLEKGLGPVRYMTISVHTTSVQVFRQIRNLDHFGTCTTSVHVIGVPLRYIPLRYIDHFGTNLSATALTFTCTTYCC